jgi:hypothetical protein
MKCNTKLKQRLQFQMQIVLTYILITDATDPKFCQQDVDYHENYKIRRTNITPYVTLTSQST